MLFKNDNRVLKKEQILQHEKSHACACMRLSPQSLEVASLMRSLRRILPDGFLGTEEINATFRIRL